jgi:NAD(P)H dehydrogenase (quinone)
MKILTVYAHPDPTSFCHAVLEQFTKASGRRAHQWMIDLYATGFDPCSNRGILSNWLRIRMP